LDEEEEKSSKLVCVVGVDKDEAGDSAKYWGIRVKLRSQESSYGREVRKALVLYASLIAGEDGPGDSTFMAEQDYVGGRD
jgi:hypothetical protein